MDCRETVTIRTNNPDRLPSRVPPVPFDPTYARHAMTQASDNLKTWKPSKAVASEKWRDDFDNLLKDKALAASAWKTTVSTATKELGKELDQADADMAEFEARMKAFHEDAESRLKNLMTMIDGLSDKKASPGLIVQAKAYAKVLNLDLADPVDAILSAAAGALQSNRLNITSDADIAAGAKINKNVPMDAMKGLLADYKKRRKALIDKSNDITNKHTDKIKTFRPRALEALATINRLESMPTENREDVKSDLAQGIKAAMNFFAVDGDGNFLKPSTQSNDMETLAKEIQTNDRKRISEVLVKAGGKDRVAAYAALTAKKYNTWKVQEKKIDLMDVVCRKLNNDTLAKEMKKLQALSDKNKLAGQKYKQYLESIVTGWTSTSDLRAK